MSLTPGGYDDSGMVAISHNPNDLVDWMWVVGAFLLVAALVLLVGVIVVRAVQRARSKTTEDDSTR